MRITCYHDPYSSMGYIYLMPPSTPLAVLESENGLFKHLKPDQISIPYITEMSISSYLDTMPIADNDFQGDSGKGYDTEFGNDINSSGYITGIELTLEPDRFLDLLRQQSFQVIRTEWRNTQFHVITLDFAENIFNSENIMYKMTEEEDTYVILRLDRTGEFPIASFKALITSRNDLYPLDYLLKPDFILKEEH